MSNPWSYHNSACPNCAQATVSGAAYCQHCGHGLSGHASPADSVVRSTESAEAVAQRLSDAEFVFYLWLASLTVLGLASAAYKIYDATDILLIALLFVAYIWVFLLVRLDQLASAIGRNPVFWVYSSLLLPVLGNFLSYYHLRQDAELRIRQLRALPV